MLDKVYVVVAYYLGSRQRRSHVVGVFSSFEKAEREAKKEEKHQEERYACEILTMAPDVSYDRQHIDRDSTYLFKKIQRSKK